MARPRKPAAPKQPKPEKRTPKPKQIGARPAVAAALIRRGRRAR
jgi:hypothetical protein